MQTLAGVTLDECRTFANQGLAYVHRFRDKLAKLAKLGPIAGYGASQRTTALIGMSGLSAGDVSFLVDKNVFYQGRILPGIQAPIYHPVELERRLPHSTILFARSFEAEIVEENNKYLLLGGKFVSTADAKFKRIAHAQ
jgi:hypothetical protein